MTKNMALRLDQTLTQIEEAAELRGPDSNEPKHGGSSPNAPDFDPDNEYQNNMRQAVQDLEDLPTNVPWTWTDDGGMMDWLVKRLDFTNTSRVGRYR